MKIRSIAGIGLILLIACIGLYVANGAQEVLAQNNPAEVAAPESASGVSTGLALEEGSLTEALRPLIRMLSALIIVLFAIYAGVYLLRRLTGRRAGGFSGANALHVIQSASVGPKKSVALVRVADRSVLVGVTENQISILTELTEEETEKILAAEPRHARESFRQVFDRTVGRLRAPRVKGGEAVMET